MVGQFDAQSFNDVARNAKTPKESPVAAQRKRAALLFILPLIGALGAVAGWPLARTFYFAFTDATLATIETPRFVGRIPIQRLRPALPIEMFS